MRIHSFTLVVQELSDELIDAVAGRCSDSGTGTRSGETYVDFDREAPSLGAAIDSAMSDLASLGITVLQIRVDELQPA